MDVNLMSVGAFWWYEGLRFECLGCGRCCRGDSGGIFMLERELCSILRFCGMGLEEFRERYMTSRWRFPSLKEKRGGACVFHEGDNRCGIYSVRPRYCRTWPFWPEVLESREAWEDVARFCPGMNVGKFYEGWQIELILGACVAYECELERERALRE